MKRSSTWQARSSYTTWPLWHLNRGRPLPTWGSTRASSHHIGWEISSGMPVLLTRNYWFVMHPHLRFSTPVDTSSCTLNSESKSTWQWNWRSTWFLWTNVVSHIEEWSSWRGHGWARTSGYIEAQILIASTVLHVLVESASKKEKSSFNFEKDRLIRAHLLNFSRVSRAQYGSTNN